MNQWRSQPRMRRLIQHRSGLYFKAGGWTACVYHATVFTTLQEALHARRRFGLEEIRFINASEMLDIPWLNN